MATSVPQYNEGEGGCFPWHYDNPCRPNKRRVTCLVYLNPDWTAGDGGEIVLAPFLDRAVSWHHIVLPAAQLAQAAITTGHGWTQQDTVAHTTQLQVKITPIFDRAVFFLSDRVLHRVLPSEPVATYSTLCTCVLFSNYTHTGVSLCFLPQ